jgi:hypothetical protein
MIGDLQQLAPVVREEDWEILKAHYIWIFLGLAALVALYAAVHHYVMKGKAQGARGKVYGIRYKA